MIDLRSDTVTRPTPDMLKAMFRAKVGDDVFEEDPTVNELQDRAAKLFGHESALFCASGSMCNQIAIKVHTQPGDEVICHRLSHVYNYEGGGIAMNSGASVRLIENERGTIQPDQIKQNINADDPHHPVTRLVCVEDTCNKAGGAIQSFENLKTVADMCAKANLKYHLDGARVFNALIETKTDFKTYGQLFDSISFCLSKGLGAPVGSMLLGNKEFIHKARRVRKVFGGGMRQAGYLAAAGIYALENHIDRLKEDHSKAQRIAAVLKERNWVKDILSVESNIVIFHINEKQDAGKLVNKFREEGILCLAIGQKSIRFVTHLDVSEIQINKVCQAIKAI